MTDGTKPLGPLDELRALLTSPVGDQSYAPFPSQPQMFECGQHLLPHTNHAHTKSFLAVVECNHISRAYVQLGGAFAEGDSDDLKQLIDDDVMVVYVAAITERENAATAPMRLVRLRQARIVDASVDASKMARVEVSFESELSDGDNMRQAKEIWTFKRSLNTQDPNWLLDEVATAS